MTTNLTDDQCNQIDRAWIASQPGRTFNPATDKHDGPEHGEKYAKWRVCPENNGGSHSLVVIQYRSGDYVECTACGESVPAYKETLENPNFFSRTSDAYHDLVDAAREWFTGEGLKHFKTWWQKCASIPWEDPQHVITQNDCDSWMAWEMTPETFSREWAEFLVETGTVSPADFGLRQNRG